MSSAQLDPCRQWLGIDAVDLGDPRRVLGLLPSEADPLVVLRAADARLTLLRSIAPGPFDMARNALIKRVEESREAVLAQIAAAPKPPVPVGTQFTMPPPPSGAGTAESPPSAFAPAEPTFPAESPARKEPAAHDGLGQVVVSVKKRTVYRKQSNAGVILLLFAMLAAAASGLVYYQKESRPFKDLLARLGIVTAKPAAEEGASAKPLVWPTPPLEVVAAMAHDASSPDSGIDAATTVDTYPESFIALLEQTLVALQDERFDDADHALAQADGEAAADSARYRLTHWQALANCARGFADARNEALAADGSAREYEIDGKRLAIVEINDEQIVYRYAGKNKRLPRSGIPDKLLMAILQGWLNRKPANHLYLGAYYATVPEPDLDKAREAWHLAERGGADASELLPLLDDPVLVKAAEAGTGRDDQ